MPIPMMAATAIPGKQHTAMGSHLRKFVFIVSLFETQSPYIFITLSSFIRYQILPSTAA
jgi:hypothetical protein